jgi:hypothetical protein
MSVYLVKTLSDGAAVVRDSTDLREFVLRPDQWQAVRALPHDRQRAKVEEFVAANGADWARERGPDSPLGRGMEAGTPTTDHSSEPQA